MNECQVEKCPHLTEEKIEYIAQRAAELAIERVYTQVGKSVVSKVFWMAGAVVIALFAWAQTHGLGK